jgi:hypothetical protein
VGPKKLVQAGRLGELTARLLDRHANCVRRLTRLLSRALVDVAMLDVQNPVVLGEHDAPQPDLALLKPPLGRL